MNVVLKYCIYKKQSINWTLRLRNKKVCGIKNMENINFKSQSLSFNFVDRFDKLKTKSSMEGRFRVIDLI